MTKTERDYKERLRGIGEDVRGQFARNRRVLSFDEYMAVVAEAPRQHLRGTAQYLRDMFDHYGTTRVRHPSGEITRFRLFDEPWNDGEGRLVGQEELQNALFQTLSTYVRQRRIDRLILLHGPNGSSKSTATEMLSRAMEDYSNCDEGPLYCFNWIFPTRGEERGGIGFQRERELAELGDSYAHLDDGAIDARLPCELRDHPLLLVPRGQRAPMIEELLRNDPQRPDGDFLVSDYVLNGDLCHRCNQIFEALLISCDGDYLRVLRHVQVERFYVSRRYRRGTARVEPQMAVDARSRQITADRSISALPAALQNTALYEVDGELVDGNRGVVDYADLLKRPLEAYKYLLTTVEGGRVALDPTNLFLDLLFVASGNENHLNAFMESPEWMSFKARIELIRVPYLRDYLREREIYDQQLPAQQVGKPIAPHSTTVAALWAVLTRLHKPDLSLYEGNLKELVGKLTPLDKALLYAERRIPAGTSEDDAKLLRANLDKIHGETDRALVYEGRTGASPREIKTVLMNAAQDPAFKCVTPEAVFKQLEQLTQQTAVYAFLRQDPQGNGFLDHRRSIQTVREWYLHRADEDIRSAMGLIEEASYGELFGRYINHVTHFVRKEQLYNPVTKAFEDPDPGLMEQVEQDLGIQGDAEEFRQSLMTKIGAWSVDHPGSRPDYSAIFADHLGKLRDHYFEQQRRRVGKVLDDALKVMVGERSTLAVDEIRAVETMLQQMYERFGYCEACAREALTQLVRWRYSR